MLDAEDGALFGRLAFKGSTQHPLPGAGPDDAEKQQKQCKHRKCADAEGDQKTTEFSQSLRDFDIPLIKFNSTQSKVLKSLLLCLIFC